MKNDCVYEWTETGSRIIQGILITFKLDSEAHGICYNSECLVLYFDEERSK